MTPNTPTAERSLWLIGAALLLGASIWLQAIFWYQAASNDAIRAAHIAVGIATTVIYLAACCSLTISFQSGRAGRGLIACFAAITACILAILCQSGTYSYSETQLANKSKNAKDAIDASRERVHAIAQDADSQRNALQGQLDALDADIARLQAQSADFSARGMISKGTALIEPQIADARARRESVANQLAGIAGVAHNEPVATIAPLDAGPFDALFTTLSDFSGRPPHQLRAWFLLALPVLHELWLGVSTIMLTSVINTRKTVEPEEVKKN